MTSVYLRPVRLLTAALFAASRASLWCILALLLIADDPPLTPQVLAELLAVCWLVPGTASRLIRRAFAAEVSADGAALVLRRRDLRVEVPLDSVERIEPWALPLPAPGFSLRLRSGRRLGYVVEAADLAAILDALTPLPAADAARRGGAVAYARARRAGRGGLWRRPLVKYVLFALGPTAIFFNAHQHIAYGATLGQYYLEGLVPWLQTFAVYWATMVMYLLLFASVWRGLAEAVALLAAGLAPRRAPAVRRAVEIVCQVAYYGGVPALTGLRFLN